MRKNVIEGPPPARPSTPWDRCQAALAAAAGAQTPDVAAGALADLVREIHHGYSAAAADPYFADHAEGWRAVAAELGSIHAGLKKLSILRNDRERAEAIDAARGLLERIR